MHSQLVTVLVTIGGLLPIGGIGLWSLRKMHTGLVKAVSEGVANQLRPIEHEMRPNSGTSMKDQMTRVESGLTVLSARVDQNAETAEKGFERTRSHLRRQDKKIGELARKVAQP
jgi:hypothetical protein